MRCACRESWELYSTKHIEDLATLNTTTMTPCRRVPYLESGIYTFLFLFFFYTLVLECNFRQNLHPHELYCSPCDIYNRSLDAYITLPFLSSPSILNCDQNLISPYDINTLTHRRVMRITKLINCRILS